MPDAQTLPNFFIVGTGKAGTTSLYHYLSQHPQIFMSPLKEPCYFASEICTENLAEDHRRHIRRMSRRIPERFGDSEAAGPSGWLVKDWMTYVRLFENVRDQTAIGEASVAYLWSTTAAGNIAAELPDAKIVIILRDPAERAFSQYLHQLSMGMVCWTFREHIENCIRYRGPRFSVYHPFLEVGLYYAQVQRYLQLFPRNNIQIYWYEDAWKDPRRFLRDLFEFLGVRYGIFSGSISKKLGAADTAVCRFSLRSETVRRNAPAERTNSTSVSADDSQCAFSTACSDDGAGRSEISSKLLPGGHSQIGIAS
jgi:Sulfotransferase family